MSFDQMPRTPHSLTMLQKGVRGQVELRIVNMCKISSIHSRAYFGLFGTPGYQEQCYVEASP